MILSNLDSGVELDAKVIGMASLYRFLLFSSKGRLSSAWFFINDFNGRGLSKLTLIGRSDLRYEKHIIESWERGGVKDNMVYKEQKTLYKYKMPEGSSKTVSGYAS